jgi:hypothetical protein
MHAGGDVRCRQRELREQASILSDLRMRRPPPAQPLDGVERRQAAGLSQCGGRITAESTPTSVQSPKGTS